jgi:hypothetical protein
MAQQSSLVVDCSCRRHSSTVIGNSFFRMLPFTPVLVAALATMPIGYVWYSPWLFAKPWMKYNNIHHMQMKKSPGIFPFAISLFSAIVLAFYISFLVDYMEIQTLQGAWRAAFLGWFAFDFVPGWMRQLFDKRPFELLMINSGHAAANVLVITWVLMLMR